ncbi:hypothetical protein [Demequina sp.]|uniref:hypothetical protein n=1 Tax=Demequina sp. TaxID=2050685 RepID=UPI003D0D70D1
MSTKAPSTIAKVTGILSGAAAITVIAILGYTTDHGSFAKGAIIGGAAVLIAMIVLWSGVGRSSTASRMASGQADERERHIFREAAADAGLAMFGAGVACAIWALFDAEAIGVAGIVLWTGLLTWGISMIVRLRRG